LSHDFCLEVVVMQGRSDALEAIANRILGMRGVKHGGIEIVAGLDLDHGHQHPHEKGGRRRP
jgi:CopG family nickel-responsive transcriptional regulator